MKNIFTLILLFVSCLAAAQPDFHGISGYKGGSIFKYTGSTQEITTVYKHQVNEVFPAGSLSKGPDGQLYGLTLSGGVDGGGAIYRYDPQTGTYTLLYAFGTADGVQPTGEICWGADGKIYGLTNYGGSANNGVLFSFDPVSKKYQVLHHFDGLQGANPVGGLYKHVNGLLYGVTLLGGSNDEGVLFSFNPATSVFEKLADFNMASGANPCTGLVAGADGKLYGATGSGGPEEAHAGNIYRFDPVMKTVTAQYYFRWDNTNGFAPVGPLRLLADGNLYGVNQRGGINGMGAIFRFNPASKVFTHLKSFDALIGGEPAGALEVGANGRFYGTTRNGNTHNHGGIFSYDPVANTMISLHSFAYGDGIDASGALCLATNGKLYGVAPFGGGKEYGTLFAYDLANANFSKLKEFDEAPDGAYPVAAPVRHTDGIYYGATTGGGQYGKGVIYSFNPGSGQYQSVYRFSEANGQYMGAGFVAGAGGKLYGLMSSGGAHGVGQVFSFDPAAKSAEVLYNFSYEGGAYPDGGLLKGDDGAFYGTTTAGGTSDYGTVFRFNPATLAYSQLASFTGANGATPMDGLTLGLDGRLYGVSQSGGASGMGVLFVFDPATAAITTLHHFDGAGGARPLRGLVTAVNGKLYGATPGGGNFDNGVLFQFDPIARTFTVLHHFNGTEGAYPQGRLSLASDGSLYGATQNGGTSDQGVLFRFGPATGSFTLLRAFGGSGSGNASGSALSEYCSQPTTFFRDQDKDGFGNTGNSVLACAAPAGYVAAGGDCNDKNAAIRPGVAEVCGNGIDDNCNGQVDEACGGQPILQVQGISIVEGTGMARISVTLNKPAPKKAQVHYRTVGGSAVVNKDFAMREGVLHFAVGSTSATIYVPIFNDKVVEADEQFRIIFFKAKEIKIPELAASVQVVIQDQKFGRSTPLLAAAAQQFKSVPLMEDLSIQAYPNPSNAQFLLRVGTHSNEPVQLRVTDASGKTVEVRRGLMAGQVYGLGSSYAPGFYMVQVVQGQNRTVLKLVKR